MKISTAFLAAAVLAACVAVGQGGLLASLLGTVYNLSPGIGPAYTVPPDAGSAALGCTDEDLLTTKNPTVQSARQFPNYDASLVDWDLYIATIKQLAQRERRICTFAIRMMFHDSGATAKDGSGGTWQGADASVMANYEEVVLPHNTQHGEAPMMRYIMERLSAYFGCSWADGLSVAAAVCTESLGSTVNIANYCRDKDLPLYVNKYDFVDPISDTGKRDRYTKPRPPHATSVADRLPTGDASVIPWTAFWLEQSNTVLREDKAGAKWEFTVGDGAALMGSHAILDIQDCARDVSNYNPFPLHKFNPGVGNALCSGRRRRWTWDNKYYKDMLSGEARVHTPGKTCTEPGYFSAGSPKCVRGSGTGDDGRSPYDSASCEFETKDFESKTNRILQAVRRRQASLDLEMSQENSPGSQFCRWFPNQATRAPCCGWECMRCGDTPFLVNRPWCKEGRESNEAPWLYTVNDCHIQTALRRQYAGYCDETKDDKWCKGKVSSTVKDAINNKLLYEYKQMRDSNQYWLNSYAIGHCKLNRLGARFASKGPIDLTTLLGRNGAGCYVNKNGRSLSDIVNFILSEQCPVSKAEVAVANSFKGKWTTAVGGVRLY